MGSGPPLPSLSSSTTPGCRPSRRIRWKRDDRRGRQVRAHPLCRDPASAAADHLHGADQDHGQSPGLEPIVSFSASGHAQPPSYFIYSDLGGETRRLSSAAAISVLTIPGVVVPVVARAHRYLWKGRRMTTRTADRRPPRFRLSAADRRRLSIPLDLWGSFKVEGDFLRRLFSVRLKRGPDSDDWLRLADLAADSFQRLHHVLAAILEAHIVRLAIAECVSTMVRIRSFLPQSRLVVDKVHCPDLVRPDRGGPAW